ncbi:MAG: hypothetical protein NC238_03100 [Dehalobacter sp.]|nr:hypothetical protein [Dehalobacter sp.]
MSVVITEPEINSYFLCSKSALPELLKQAEHEKANILSDLKAYVKGNIDIVIRQEFYPMGYAVAGDLLVNGEVARSYDCIDLLFLDLNNLMFSILLKQ